MTRPLALLLATLVTAAPLAAHAQNNTTRASSEARCAGAPSRTEGHQEFCFDNENVQGDPALSRGVLVRPPPRTRAVSLIRHRMHYVNEMLKSVENL